MNKFVKDNRYLIAILFSVILISFSFLVRFTYSKYQESVQNNKTSRVALFLGDGMVVENLTDDDEMVPGETINIPVSISNFKGASQTETSYTYNLSLENFASLPLEWTLKKDGVPESLLYSGKMTPGKKQELTDEFILTVTWPEDMNDYSYAGQLKALRLRLDTQQLD
ncbi:hypothetical protein [Enterococcus sp. AZ103]|uniref:hypothetical protein n=1 Tax=Enterococcus sp. AZ103 TaxID=2774628 RepID=UPI003F231312